MRTAQQEIRDAVDHTNRVLNALSPHQLAMVRVDTAAELDRWCREEWIPLKPYERALVERCKRVARECALVRETLAFGQ